MTSTGQGVRLMREVGIFYLGYVKCQGLAAPEVALDNQLEKSLLGLWAEMMENGTFLQTRHILIGCTHCHNEHICFWCREVESW